MPANEHSELLPPGGVIPAEAGIINKDSTYVYKYVTQYLFLDNMVKKLYIFV